MYVSIFKLIVRLCLFIYYFNYLYICKYLYLLFNKITKFTYLYID